MEWFLSKHLMLVLIALIQISGLKACLEEERTGLLEFKRFLKSNNGDAEGVLGSWVDDKAKSDCCEWDRVQCNSITGHVIELSLSNVRQIDDSRCSTLDKWSLNASLFRPFQDLISLDLSANCFDGFVEDEGFGKLSSLKKLEVLNLRSNIFNAGILPSLGTLTSLRALTIGRTYRGGTSSPIKDFERLSGLKKLEILMIKNYDLDNSILPCLGTLTSLKNLSVSGNRLSGSFPPYELASLENLEILNASMNGFNADQTANDSRRLPRMNKLKTLDLSYNSFGVNIFQSLTVLPSLRNLMLSYNSLQGALPVKEVANLKYLESLDLSYNSLEGSLNVQGLVGFEKLEVLDISKNQLTGSIPGFIWNLSSLQILSLRENELSGPLPTEAFCRTNKLQKLDLSGNSINGMLPSCLGNLNSLRELDFSSNQFTGNLPSSLMSNLTSLEYIDLGYNHFTGLFSFSSFADHRNLEVVALPGNDANFEVETEYTAWVPQFQLKVLALSRCNLNKRTRDVPKFLSHQPYLLYIDLSHNNLKGNLPTWMLENKTMLQYLYLRNNSFNGQFPLPSYPNKLLSELDISKNHFSGALGGNFGEMLPRVGLLNLAENDFEGQIPSSIGKMYSLTRLDLSSNNFSGEVTTELTAGWTYLAILKLSNNRFHGPIFSTQCNMRSLMVLLLDNNQFTGTLSEGFLRCPFSLVYLDIGNNYFSGEIPLWIDRIVVLQVLIMQNNSFHGEIRHQFPSVNYLDISYNLLNGSLPLSLLNGTLKHIHLQGNAFTGSLPIPKHVLYPGNLLTLDLANNNLSGKIPDSIGQFSELKILSLRGNNFAGRISNSLCQLSKISILDLSNNNLSGPIPSCFKNITFGKREVTDLYAFVRELFMIQSRLPVHNYVDKLKEDPNSLYFPQVEVEFITKNRHDIYKGDILNFMSGLDLSSNNLVGEIPYELGQLTSIRALNLSHNRLTGTIPKDFSKLRLLESLDLSDNSLSGEIPSELTNLNFLAVFNVAHNNLSGRIPGSIAQFGTFDESSYEGNPFLCGSMIKRKCETIEVQPPVEQSEQNWYEIDHVVFSASFAASYITILLVFFALLYINPRWRRRWFYLTEECMYSCYYFAYDMINKLTALLCK